MPAIALRVLPPQRLAGEDDDAGVDVVRVHAGRRVGRVDDLAEAAIVDALLALVRRQHDVRLEQGLARDDEVAARQVLAEAAQIDLREDDLRS